MLEEPTTIRILRYGSRYYYITRNNIMISQYLLHEHKNELRPLVKLRISASDLSASENTCLSLAETSAKYLPSKYLADNEDTGIYWVRTFLAPLACVRKVWNFNRSSSSTCILLMNDPLSQHPLPLIKNGTGDSHLQSLLFILEKILERYLQVSHNLR